VTNPELPGLFNLLYGIPAPPTPRNDLVAVFLTGLEGLNKPANPNQVACEMLRLNMAIAPAAAPNRLGVIAGDVAGFPNGRRLADDIVDIEERVAAGILVPGFNNAPANQLGDGVDGNDKPYLPYFPYVALPHDPLNNVNDVEQKGSGAAIEKLYRPGAATAPQAALAGEAKLALGSANPGPSHILASAVPQTARVTLKVYAANGRLVRTLVDQDAAAGSFRAVWDGKGDDGAAMAKGVYFARYTTNGSVSDDRKLILQ
jgi:hypothetical protein